jgi:hypothetical protein
MRGAETSAVEDPLATGRRDAQTRGENHADGWLPMWGTR